MRRLPWSPDTPESAPDPGRSRDSLASSFTGMAVGDPTARLQSLREDRAPAPSRTCRAQAPDKMA